MYADRQNDREYVVSAGFLHFCGFCHSGNRPAADKYFDPCSAGPFKESFACDGFGR